MAKPNRSSVTSRKPVAKAAGVVHPAKAQPKGKPGHSKTKSLSAAGKPKTAKPAPSKAKPGKPAKQVKVAAPPVKKKPMPAAASAPKGRPLVHHRAVPAPPPKPSGPTIHEMAVERFEQGFKALQEREFRRASDLLNSVVNEFPDEKELHDRARVYLTICERQAASRAVTPRTFEERVYAATVTINRGAYDEGLSQLRLLEGEAPAHDHVQYMLAVVHTLRGQPAQAVTHLERAIELNEQNRYLASQDADLELLREYDGVTTLLETHPLRRSAPRPRLNR